MESSGAGRAGAGGVGRGRGAGGGGEASSSSAAQTQPSSSTPAIPEIGTTSGPAGHPTSSRQIPDHPPPPPEQAPPQPQPPSAAPLSRYESQKRRDWNTFLQYLRNHKPPLSLSRCSGAHVIEFLKYLDQFGKTKVHVSGTCPYFGHPNPPAPCACPLKQAWGSLDALIGRLRAAYEENGGGRPESNPFAARAVRIYLREVREAQAKARGIPYEKKKRKRTATGGSTSTSGGGGGGGETTESSSSRSGAPTVGTTGREGGAAATTSGSITGAQQQHATTIITSTPTTTTTTATTTTTSSSGGGSGSVRDR